MTAKNKDPFAELLSFTAANGTNINNNIGISNTNNNNNSSLSLDEQRRRAAAAPSQTLNPNPILNANVAPIMASGNYSPHSRQSSNYASRDSGSTFQSNLDSFSVSNPIQSNLQYSANGTANNIGFSTLAPPSPLQSRSNSSQYSYQSTTLTPPISNPSKTGNKNRDAFADLLVEARSPSGKPGNFTISSSTGNNHVPLNSLASSATSTNTFITNYPNSGTFIGSNSVNNNTFTPEQQVSQPSSYLNQQLHPQLVFSTAEIHSQKSSHADIWDFDALTSTVTTGQAPNESDPFGLGFSNSQIPNQQKQEEEEDLFAIFNKPRAPSPPPRPEITSKPISPTIQSSEIRANIPQSPRSTAITSITDMGFLRANAIAALDAAQGDVERAISFLLANNRDSSLSPDRSPPPRPPRRSNFDTAQSPNSPVTPNASAAVALATNAKNLFEFGRAKLGAAYVKASERVAAVVEGFDVGNSGGANSGTVNSSDMWDREGQNRWADNDGGSASRYRDDTSSDEEEEIHLVHRRKPVGGNAKVVQSPIISASSRQEFSGENGFRSLQSPQHQQSHTDVFAFDNIVASGTPLAASSHLNQTKSRPPQPPASRKPASLRYTATPSQRAIAATHRERGNDLFKAGQYAAADEAYSVAILTLPVDDGDLIALRNNRAAARLKIGDYVGVITDCDAVQAIDARDPKSLLRRAAAWEGRERWNEALRDYESLMRLDSSIKGVTEGLARSRKGVAEFSGDGTGVFAGRASAGGENLWISDGLAPRTTPLANQSNKPISAKAQAAVEKAVDAVRTQINVQEREDEEKFQAKEAVEAKIENWKRGKDQNIRALLSSLDSVLWAELEWKTIGLSELITPQQVKIKYMKAVAKVHPDKLKQGTTTEQKLIAQEVFSVLNTAWDSFKSAKNENFQMADNGQGTASAEQTPDAGQKEQTLAGPIRWVGPALKHSDGLWSPIQVVDATVPDDPDVDSDNDSKNDHNALVPNPLFDLTPAAIVDELGKLRTDLKLLADAFTHHRHLTKAESDSALASFFENVRSMEKEADSTSNSVATVLDHEAVLNAQKSMPHYMAILTHAAVIVQEIARNADISHPEEFLSLYHAKEIIRDIDQELSAKKKEIEVLKEKISSLEVELANATRIQPVPTSPVSKPVWRTSSPPSISIPPTFVEVVVPPSQQNGSSQSLIGGAFGYLRRASSAFIQPASKQALVVSTTDLATKNSISAPDDLYAPLIARGGWMLSKDTYDFFISYRVASDAKIAMELYFRLKDQRVVDEHGNSRHVRVYWDKECLKKGQDWHDGFVEGLKNSRCVLMIVSAGAIERMAASDKYGDNVLLEWETAVLSGEFGICIPQPVFINDPSAKSKGYDALTAFRSSDKCPKLRSMASGAHHLSAYTTLGEISKLQGINLNTEEVSWVIPDCMKALTTYIPVKSGAVAKQCHTEASFFKYFSDSKYFSGIPFESKNYFIDFLTSNDLKELFGYEAEGKEGILKYRQHLESLKLTFKGFFYFLRFLQC
ncbi:hypothetical protein HK100_007141 [Physocladia obscura]|uniref:UBA domain-containing protein n=1 Tax=Physocladia obscura TaxID=109957 RepID=A0AAD5T4V7_9FUNG|nr:hypothetical protein HK100_007141 [Physocladia obscura]